MRRVKRLLVEVVAVLVAAALLWWVLPKPDPPDTVHVAAVGNMACASAEPEKDGWCQEQAVSDLLVGRDLDALLGLGDYQYEEARGADYEAVYDPTFGRFKSITRPAIGNQEYKVRNANTFFAYFGDRAGPRRGWWSYDLGRWHVVVLNSNCAIAGGCGPGSEQLTWLEQDLARNDAPCTIAYWHHPRFSTGLHGSDARTRDFWVALDAAGADLVLSAHEKHYERFAPLDADGNPGGIRSFVVGTGGQVTYAPDETTGEAGSRRAEASGSEIRIDDASGLLLLELTPDAYLWRFVSTDGSVLDEGHGWCRNGEP